MTYRTQKARGIEALGSMVVQGRVLWTNALTCGVLPFEVIDKPMDLDAKQRVASLLKQSKGKAFGRPCPTVPRHGFVDSRPFTTIEELEEIWQQTIAADPQGEVIVMPLVEADWSMVVTPGGVAIGPGHDGATAGKDSVLYPVASVFTVGARKRATIAPEDDPYIELVVGNRVGYIDRKLYAVQMRGGPKTDAKAGADYVPTEMLVAEIIDVDKNNPPDALEWEVRMKNVPASDKAGLVVWHPGGTRLSHYAAHAVSNHIAVVFGQERPGLGDTLEPGEADPPYDADSLVAGVVAGLVADLRAPLDNGERANLLATAACGIHNALMLRTGPGAEYLGAALAILYRLAAAACIGEYRHKGKKTSGLPQDRSTVYRGCLAGHSESWRTKLRRAAMSFATQSWSSSYGGRNWAICAQHTIDLEEALYAVVNGEVAVERAIAVGHRLLNAVHNGGPMLDKFGNKQLLDAAADGDGLVAARGVYQWHGEIRASITTAAAVAGMKSIYKGGKVHCGPRKWWLPDEGRFLTKEEVYDASMLKLARRNKKQTSLLETPGVKAEPERLRPFVQARTTVVNYTGVGLHVQAKWVQESPPVVGVEPTVEFPPLPKPVVVPKNIYGTTRVKDRATKKNTVQPYPSAHIDTYQTTDIVLNSNEDAKLIAQFKEWLASGNVPTGTSLAGSATPYLTLATRKVYGSSDKPSVEIGFTSVETGKFVSLGTVSMKPFPKTSIVAAEAKAS